MGSTPGRCGTTFLARVLHSVGWDFGPEVSPADIGEHGRPAGGGMENPKFFSVGRQFRGKPHKERARIARRTLARIDVPRVVKDPRFLTSLPVWWDAGYRPDEVIVCVRNYAQIRDSYIRSGMRGSYQRLLRANDFSVWAALAGVKLRFVAYPHLATAPGYADRALAGLIKRPAEAVRSVWEPMMNHGVA